MKKIKELFNTFIRFVKEEKGLVLFFLVGATIILYPLPYYVMAPGGIKDISDRIGIEGKDVEKETFHTTYIKEYEGRAPILIYALFNKDYEIISAKDMIIDGEDYEDDLRRGKLYFEESFDNALISSFKLANLEYSVISSELFVLYTEENVREKLKVGDKIISIEGNEIKEADDISTILQNYNIGDNFEIEVLRDKTLKKVTSKIIEIEGKKRIGIVLSKDSKIESNPKITLNSEKNEYGPSGGFMTALSIYYTITNQNLDLKIAGTGTISDDSQVGEIGGVDKKVIAASKEDLDIFFVPLGDNYDLAMKTKEKKKLDINIVGVSNLKEAVDYISKFDK